MATIRPRRSNFSAVTKPTVVKMSQNSTNISNSEAELFLGDFLNEKDSLNQNILSEVLNDENKSVSTGVVNTAVISQLKRIQRELRGLPPTLESSAGFNKKRRDDKPKEKQSLSQNTGKHTKFEDDEELSDAKKESKEEVQESKSGKEEESEEDKEEVAIKREKDFVLPKVEEETKEETKKEKKDKKKKDKKSKKDKKRKLDNEEAESSDKKEKKKKHKNVKTE